MARHLKVYTGPTMADVDRIPVCLKVLLQWVLWRGEDRVDEKTGEIKLNKIPINPQTLGAASTTDPTTWGRLEDCWTALPGALRTWQRADPDAYRGGGIGFVFTADDPYTGIDLDQCRDPETEAIAPWAQEILDAFPSYTEVTPSRTGLHILAQGILPPGGRKKGNIEMYSEGRFFTVTGWQHPQAPATIRACQAALTDLHTRTFGPPERPKAPRPAMALSLDDTDLLAKARAAKNGAKFAQLWGGDTALHDKNNSVADLALCCELAFWTQDPAQIDRLFRQSGLMREKWDERRGAQTYGARTVQEALARQTEHYRSYDDTQQRRNCMPDDPWPSQKHAADARPVVRLGPDITRLVDEGQAALLALPGPVLFQRARRLTIIARGVKPPRWLRRPADAPVIAQAQAAYLEELATQAARWEKYDKRARKGEEWVEVTPPSRFVQTLQARPSWPFPLLEGIIHSPTLRPDGSLLDTPGYDPETGLYFDSNGTIFPALPAHSTLDDARSALGRLQEVVKDFPFAKDCHFSAWLSAVLSVVCRATVQGCVPLHGITATTRGSGKTLLADTIALIGTNHPAARWSQVFDEDEERKRLLALALDGDPLVCIDNVSAPLGSGVLALALTGQSFKDRLLGVNETREAPLNAVFLCTGNNVQYVGDVARRVVPIAIDPVMECPEERTGFAHPQLLAWVKQERARLTIAALTIVKAYCDAGRPPQGLTPFGSFEAWSDLIRQASVWAGEPDPCEGRKEIEATSNPEFETLAGLLHTWHACYSTTLVTLAQAEEDTTRKMQHVGPDSTANQWNELHAALGACDTRFDGKQFNTRRVGNALRSWQGRVIDGKRLVSPGRGGANKTLWKVEVITP